MPNVCLRGPSSSHHRCSDDEGLRAQPGAPSVHLRRQWRRLATLQVDEVGRYVCGTGPGGDHCAAPVRRPGSGSALLSIQSRAIPGREVSKDASVCPRHASGRLPRSTLARTGPKRSKRSAASSGRGGLPGRHGRRESTSNHPSQDQSPQGGTDRQSALVPSRPPQRSSTAARTTIHVLATSVS